MLERNDLMNTKMNSMKKLAALMAVITSVSTLTACGNAMDTSGSDYAMNNEKGAQHYTEAAIAAEDYESADDEAMPPEMNSVDDFDIQQNDEEYNYIKEALVDNIRISSFRNRRKYAYEKVFCRLIGIYNAYVCSFCSCFCSICEY